MEFLMWCVVFPAACLSALKKTSPAVFAFISDIAKFFLLIVIVSVPFSLFGFWVGLLCLLAVPFLVFGFCYLVFLLEDRAYTHGRKNGEKR